jgi:hypothetical protein
MQTNLHTFILIVIISVLVLKDLFPVGMAKVSTK